MVVVHELNERLDLGPSLDFLLAHSPGYFQWISLDTGHQSVSEFLVLQQINSHVTYLLSVVVLLDNDSFLSSMSSSKQNHDSARFHTTATVRPPQRSNKGYCQRILHLA